MVAWWAGGAVAGAMNLTAGTFAYSAFYAKRAELRHDNACPCEVCRRIDDLQLKVVVHRGPLLHYRVKDFEDLSGMPIIAARRLMKNSLDRDQYILVTEAAADAIKLPLAAVWDRHVERYDDVGEIAAHVYEFEPLISVAGTSFEHHGPVAGRMRDAVKKLAQNARALGRSIGPSASQQPAE